LQGGRSLFGYLPEQVGFVFEVVVDQAGRPDAGLLRYIPIGGFLETSAGEHAQGGVNYLLASAQAAVLLFRAGPATGVWSAVLRALLWVVCLHDCPSQD
jgi:hypothetical protein